MDSRILRVRTGRKNRICTNCGNQIEDGAASCPDCGAPVMTESAKSGQKTDREQPLDRKAFCQHPNTRHISKQLKVCGIILYILGIINFWNYLVIGVIAMAFFELILWIGLGMGIHLKQSRVCAIVVTVIGALNMIV